VAALAWSVLTDDLRLAADAPGVDLAGLRKPELTARLVEVRCLRIGRRGTRQGRPLAAAWIADAVTQQAETKYAIR
jgi:hypothetical protein